MISLYYIALQKLPNEQTTTSLIKYNNLVISLLAITDVERYEWNDPVVTYLLIYLSSLSPVGHKATTIFRHNFH